SDLSAIADAYVRLVLAIGRHDEMYVDAYYGPREWKEEAAKGEPRPVPDLLREARELLTRLRAHEPSERRDFLEKQLVSAEGFLRRLSGEAMTLDQEARLLYDIDPPIHGVEEFEQARARVESLLPGDTDLAARVKAFRDRFIVPPDRLDTVVRNCLEVARKKTVESVALPQGEAFRVSFVKGKPWGAYNWYEGNLTSLIEVNTDLPIELGRILDTLAHEGYPGHHTYNALLEEKLVRGKGWREFTVYALYSPQSVVAEGTANAGLSIVMSDPEKLAVLRDLAPLAGLDGRDLERYQAVREAMRSFRFVRGEAARTLLDQGGADDEAARFIARYSLEEEARAKKGVDFIRAYR
ncbi:MAG: hypothetical protein ACRD1Z_00155, partial [Vicinamibacteria bacterium]